MSVKDGQAFAWQTLSIWLGLLVLFVGGMLDKCSHPENDNGQPSQTTDL